MVEETEKSGDEVRVLTPVYPRQNVGRQGADIRSGQRVLQAGTTLTPSRVGAMAALGLDPEKFHYSPLAQWDTATDKAIAVAGTIAVVTFLGAYVP